MDEKSSVTIAKHNREALRSVTVRLNCDTVSFLDDVATDLRWSTSRLISQLVERSTPALNQYRKANDMGGLFSHLLTDADAVDKTG